MNKKVILGMAGLVLGLAGASVNAVHAEEGVIEETIGEEDIEATSDYDNTVIYDEEYWSNDEDGDMNNEEADDSSWDETMAEEDAKEEDKGGAPLKEAEPVLWPMWLSFGAIGVAIVAIIIFNLAGRKYKK